jgi:hypothetical protein
MVTQAANELVFVFIGGEHQVLHLAPIAAEISRHYPQVPVHCICADESTTAAIKEVRRLLDAPRLKITRPTRISRLATRLAGARSAAKVPLLASIRCRARKARAIIAPERTSAHLRWLGWRRPLIHFRHGAGDRTPASESRLKAFDAIFVPGAKDIERAVRQGVERERLTAVGYIKLDYLRHLTSHGSLFDNDRKVVFYNPHFDASISSIALARDVIARFREQDRYNLVFAPHVRAFENLGAAGREAWNALAIPGRIIIDIDSPRLFDMTYVNTADVYLGDMSSQLYEFLSRPRPAVFLNAHAVHWAADPRYAGWHLGSVATGADDVLATIDQAIASHDALIPRQAEAVAFAFGNYEGSTGRGAAALLAVLDRL